MTVEYIDWSVDITSQFVLNIMYCLIDIAFNINLEFEIIIDTIRKCLN